MYEFDWSNPYKKRIRTDTRNKKEKLKDDFEMIFCASNINPMSEWLLLWYQLLKHILLK